MLFAPGWSGFPRSYAAGISLIIIFVFISAWIASVAAAPAVDATDGSGPAYAVAFEAGPTRNELNRTIITKLESARPS